MADILGAFIGADAAGDAADAQAGAAREASRIQKEMFDTVNRQNLPALAARNAVISRLSELLGLPPEMLARTSIQSGAGTTGGGNPLLNGLAGMMQSGSLQHDGGWETSRPTIPLPQNGSAQNGLSFDPGYSASSPLYGALNRQFTGADLANDPGYKFRLSQGLGAVQGSAAARGGLYSGAAMKAMNNYAQGQASGEFGDAYNRDASYKDRLFNMLSGLGGLGAGVTSQTQSYGMNTANELGNNAIGAGNALAAAGLARGNMWGNAVNKTISNGQSNNWWNLFGAPQPGDQNFMGPV